MQAAVWRWAPVVAWAALIFGLSSISDLGTGLGAWDTVLRKIAHAAEFAVLGFLLLRAVRREVAALALGIAYAVSDEVHQHFVPGREGAPLDVLIDAVGVILGVWLGGRLAFRLWTARRTSAIGSSTRSSSGSTGSRRSSEG